ncbi:ubiquitin-related domain-containing protein [Podospora didyma]|uniref:Ubiquitin-related domain-containing protein n=1 Tax=Podospora didyma TaxID=330526 RepID=A0AAE0U5A4_9PEZI|nr:ubiquitin-related domain-containing protein [Podospora didyma]
MADGEPTTAASQPQNPDSLPQPEDTLLTRSLDNKETPQVQQTGDKPALPVPPKDIPSPTQPVSTTATTETLPKGKDKADPPAPIEKQGDDDSLSIEPSDPTVLNPGSSSEPLICTITLLLPTGARHPYKIDEKYLSKRNVEIPDVTPSGQKDPFSISVYKLKELILREWREEWDGKPASPTSIRLIHFGKLLDDKEQLKKYHFTLDSANVVHMSVRPPEMMEEEEAGKGKSSTRDGRSREGGGGCCVIL